MPIIGAILLAIVGGLAMAYLDKNGRLGKWW